MALNLSRDSFFPLTCFHLLVLLLAVGTTIMEEHRLKDALAAFPSLLLSSSLCECGADSGAFILFRVVTGILYQWETQKCKAL